MSDPLIIGSAALHHGDSRAVLATFASASIDACVTDPPYALVSIAKRFGKEGAATAKGAVYRRASAGFMGKSWDTGDAAHDPDFWREVYRVLKPGAHVVAFAGTRTYHRLACAIEDAGFEIRDMISWLYGAGFPKSHSVAKAIGEASDWEGWGTALKPACEPIVLARKPLTGTVAANVQAHGTGALNIDACRVTFSSDADEAESKGRWPANVVHDGSAEVTEAFPDAPGQQYAVTGKEPSSPFADIYGDMPKRSGSTEPRGDSGSAARFFYSAKAGAEDRLGSKHPTVKPVNLMRWLCTLVTPPGGLVLDPFAGTGTTGLAAVGAGFRAAMIEREEEYFADMERRFRWATGDGRLTAQEKQRHSETDFGPLFEGAA